MMSLRGVLLFLFFHLGGARRSISILNFQHDAQQQNNTLANGLNVSAEAREALNPGGFRTGVLQRAGAVHFEPHRAAPLPRFGPRRAKVALQAASAHKEDQLPALCVFDMDDCLWSPEMYTLEVLPTPQDVVLGELPNGRGRGVVGLRSGADVIQLFPGAHTILQRCNDGEYDPMRLAVASSADTPFAASIAHTALSLLEVVPGVTIRDVLNRGWPEGFGGVEGRDGHIRIGRSAPLSSDKSATHFPLIRDATGIPFSEMIFFDDSNWNDHCKMVEKNCPGVVAQRTPRGLQEGEFANCLKKFAASKGG